MVNTFLGVDSVDSSREKESNLLYIIEQNKLALSKKIVNENNLTRFIDSNLNVHYLNGDEVSKLVEYQKDLFDDIKKVRNLYSKNVVRRGTFNTDELTDALKRLTEGNTPAYFDKMCRITTEREFNDYLTLCIEAWNGGNEDLLETLGFGDIYSELKPKK